MKRNVLLLSMLFFAQIQIYARTNNLCKIDSLEIELQLINDTIGKVDILNQLCVLEYASNYTKAISYSNEAISLASASGYRLGEGKAYFGLGMSNEIQKKHTEAIKYYKQASGIFNEIGYEKGIASIDNNIGIIYSDQQLYDDAMEYYLSALKIYEEMDDKKGVAITYLNISLLFKSKGDISKAKEYVFKSLKIKNEIKDLAGAAGNYNNIGNLFLAEGDTIKAIEQFRKAIDINKRLKNNYWLAINYLNIADVFCKKHQMDSSIFYCTKSLDIANNINSDSRRCSAYIVMGDINSYTLNFKSAIEDYCKAYDIAVKLNQHERIYEVGTKLSDIYRKENMPQKALQYILCAQNSLQILRENEKSNDLYRLEFQFNLEKEREKQKFEQKEKALIYQTRLLAMLLGLVLIISIGLFNYFISRNRIKSIKIKNDCIIKDKKLLEAKMESQNKEIINFALHIVQRNELVKNIAGEIKQIISSDQSSQSSKLRSLLLRIKQSTKSSEEFDKYQERTEEVYKEFFDKLLSKHPNLSKNDKQLALMLRLNFNTKEIAALTSISAKSVEVSRYRLRKKLGLHKDQNLNEYFLKI